MPGVALSGLFSNFNIQDFLITILVLCISLSFHEAAHAWAAFKLGDDTAALQGRLTLNPLAHLDPIGSICFIIGGIGWAKPVPINPTRFNRKYSIKKGFVLTSVAGPASNLVLATVSLFLVFIVLTIAKIFSAQGFILDILYALLGRLYTANIVLAVFNLLPVPPLDGFKVFGAALPNKLYYKLMQYERYIGLAFLVFVLLGQGILSNILQVIVTPFDLVIFTPLNYVFTWIWKLLGLI